MQMKRCGKYFTYSHALREYKKLLSDEGFLESDVYIFLYTKEKTRNERNLSRDKKLSKKWLNSNFNYFQNEFYKQVSKNIKNKLEIDTTEKEPDYVSNCILELLR